jgi:drug/metabolite transporter (DMT)-like permease
MVQLVLVVGQAVFATLAIAGKLALRELPAPLLVLFRVWGAAGAFLLLRRRAGLPGIRGNRDRTRVALYSLLGVVGNQLLFVQGLAYTTAINASLLITTVPVFTLMIVLGLRHERASPLKVAGLALALAGAVALVGPGSFDLSPGHALGNAMIALNALCHAAYLVLSKDLLRRYAPLTVVTGVFGWGALGVLPFGLLALPRTDLAAVHPATWFAVLYIIAVPTVAVYWLNLWALERVESSRVAIYVFVQPLVTFLIAPALLGERLELGAALAGLAILAGILLVTLERGAAARARCAGGGLDLRGTSARADERLQDVGYDAMTEPES